MRVNRHRRFDFQPRYYDERKERIEKIKTTYESKDGERITDYKARMQQKMLENKKTGVVFSKQKKAANLRLIVILTLLILAAYLILGNVELFSNEVINLGN